MMLLAALAGAATIAVLDLDGYDVDRDALDRAAQGLRDAFQERGGFEPLAGGDVAAGVSAGAEAALRAGREAVAEARRLQATGDCRGAVEAARRAEAGLRAARADLGLRTELADAMFLQGRCLVSEGRSTEAWFALREAEHLHPGYLADRGGQPGAAVERVYRDARAGLVRGERPDLAAERAREAGEALRVDHLLTGWLDVQGRIHLVLWGDGEVRSVVDGALSTMPPSELDPAYARLVDRLVTPLEEGPGAAVDATPGPRAERDSPIDRWWFWAGAGVVLAGGGAMVTALVVEPTDTVVVEPASWSLEVVGP